jgi:hypothetical protein
VTLLQELETEDASDWQSKLCDLYASQSTVHTNLLDYRLTIHGISHAYSPVLLLWIRFNTIKKTSLAIESNSRLLIWALLTIALCKRNSLYRKPSMMLSDTYFSKGVFRGNSDASLMKVGSEFQASCDRRMMFLGSVSAKFCHHSSQGSLTVLENHRLPEVRQVQAPKHLRKSYSG